MGTAVDQKPGDDQIRGTEFALFASILTAAMASRLWNLSWGLPDVFDEAAPFTVARKFWGTPGGGISFHPDFFHYPALSFYLHFLVQAVQFLAGSMTGQFESLDAFRLAMETDPGSFMIAARMVSVLFDVGTVGLVWVTARDIFGRGTAIGAALLAALNPLLLAGAQTVNVDVMLTLFLMMTLRQALRLSGHSGPREFALTGVMIGLAASTKYTGALFLALPVIVIAADFLSGTARTVRFALREIGLTILVPLTAAAVIAALNPFIILDQTAFLRDFTYEQRHMAYGHLGLEGGQSTIGFYLAGTIAPKLGLIFLAGAVAGAIIAVAGRSSGGIAIAAMAAVYIGVISSWEMRAERYLLPSIPLLSILCSAGCTRAMTWAAAESTKSFPDPALRSILSRALPAGAVCAALVVPVYESLRYHRDLDRTDTRTTAREWIAANVAPGSVITSGPFGITFPPGRTIVYIPFVATGSEAAAPFYDTRWYEDFELLIASDYDYGRYSMAPDRFGGMMKFYGDLRSDWSLLAEFGPDTLRRGPRLWFYAPDKSRRTERFDPALLNGLASVDNTELVVQFARNLSGALYSRGKTGKCEQLLELGMRLSPGDPVLARTMSFLLYKQGRFTEALEYITGAGREDGNSFELLSLHGSILVETGDPDRAEELLLRARDLRPDSPLPYTLLIRIYSGKNNTTGLIGTLEGYLSILPRGSDEALRIGRWLDSLKTAR
ncbi:MAG TPA: glycosyltransferase family 39 protein [Bacteroidota bacterium]|nr:glycosyltransferase family 39 protein [Bacteroidota bacterium]